MKTIAKVAVTWREIRINDRLRQCYDNSLEHSQTTPLTAPDYPLLATSAPTHGHFHTHPNILRPQRPSDLAPLPPKRVAGHAKSALVYQSRKRGTLESDLLLSIFARGQFAHMSIEEMREYDKVCVYPPILPSSPLGTFSLWLTISSWTKQIGIFTTNKRAPPERWANSSLLEKVIVYARNEGNVVRKMPAL